MWQPTPYVFTTELGEPCDPRNALRALRTAAKRAGLPSSVGLHTLRHCCLSDVVRWRAAQGGIGDLRSRKRCDHRRRLGHVSPEVSREALTRLSDALS